MTRHTCEHCPVTFDALTGMCLEDVPPRDHAAIWTTFYRNRAMLFRDARTSDEHTIQRLIERLRGPVAEQPFRPIRLRVAGTARSTVTTNYATWPITLGSDPRRHIVIPSAHALHATIFRQNLGCAWLLNLDPEGWGVFLKTPHAKKPEPVSGCVPLEPGQVISMYDDTFITVEDC